MAQETTKHLIQEADHAYQAGDYLSAAERYEKAALIFQQANQSLSNCIHRNNAAVCYLKANLVEKARDLLDGTDQIFADKGDIEKQAQAIGNQATAAQALGNLADAEEKYLRCISILKSIGMYESIYQVYSELTEVQLKQKKYLQAIATMDAGLTYKKNLTLRERFLKALLRVPNRILRVG